MCEYSEEYTFSNNNDIAPTMEELVAAFECIKEICEKIAPTFEELWAATKIYYNILISPNCRYGRIKHLALYGKKARVRKKNIKRLLKQGG